MTRLATLFVFIGSFISLASAQAANWEVQLAEDPFSGQSGCLMISAEQQINDGQATTPIYLVFNGSALVARTRSNIDLSYAGVGLQVDDYKPHTVDRLWKETSAVFESDPDKIREEFIRGRTARLALGFWPTWPKTRTVVSNFDLIGFTRAYMAFLQCQKTGELP